MSQINHCFVETNGIRMHCAICGTGKLVILCHGFPESWYGWRFQILALAEAGFRVVAPDLRGYGQTDQPTALNAYHILELTADLVGLVQALGSEKAMIVGHDWGAVLAWHCALLRPDLFEKLILLSVPYLPRTEHKPTVLMQLMAGEQQFYQLYFQEVGKAETELEASVAESLLSLFYSSSGDAPPSKRWRFLFNQSEKLLDTVFLPDTLPSWLTRADLDFLSQEFERTGFRGALNWYRNIDLNWQLTAFLAGAKIQQPTWFIAGELDPVITIYREAFDHLELTVPQLKDKVLLPQIGHWVQLEANQVVNRLLLQYLTS